jgi:hypothetical protein
MSEVSSAQIQPWLCPTTQIEGEMPSMVIHDSGTPAFAMAMLLSKGPSRDFVLRQQLIFVHNIPLAYGESRIFQGDSFRGTNKRGYLMTSCQSLLNNLLPSPASRSNNEWFHRLLGLGFNPASGGSA